MHTVRADASCGPPRTTGAPTGVPAAKGRSGSLFVLRVGGEDQVAHGVLCVLVRDGPEKREAAALAVDGVLPGGERDVAAGAGPPLPDREADQLQAGEDAVDEVDLSIGQLARRVALVARGDLHDGVL